MSETLGEQIGEAIIVNALHEVFVVEADQKIELRAEIARMEKEDPRTLEAFEAREARLKELMDELRELSGV